jgi:hypothetical protein
MADMRHKTLTESSQTGFVSAICCERNAKAGSAVEHSHKDQRANAERADPDYAAYETGESFFLDFGAHRAMFVVCHANTP